MLEAFIGDDCEKFKASLYKKGQAELEVLLSTIVKHRTVTNLSNQLKHVVIVSLSFIEVATKKVGIQSDGYAMAVKSQEREIQMILQEFAYDRAEKLSVMSSPALRLGMLMSSTLLLVDSANKGKNMGSKPVTENVTDKFKDI